MNLAINVAPEKIDQAIEIGARFARFTQDFDEENASYARGVVFHAIHGTNTSYVPIILEIARYGVGSFHYDHSHKDQEYLRLGETLMEIMAFMPREIKPKNLPLLPKKNSVEEQLLDVLSQLYAIAASSLEGRIGLQERTDSYDRMQITTPFTECLLLENPQRELKREAVKASWIREETAREAKKKSERAIRPLESIANNPDRYVNFFRMVAATLTGRNIDNYCFSQ